MLRVSHGQMTWCWDWFCCLSKSIPPGRSSQLEGAKGTETPKLETPDGEQQNDSDSDDTDDDGKEQSKILKQLQFPEVEPSSTFSPDMCPKIIRCLQKRMDKLSPILASMSEKPTLTNVLAQFQSQVLPESDCSIFTPRHVWQTTTCVLRCQG